MDGRNGLNGAHLRLYMYDIAHMVNYDSVREETCCCQYKGSNPLKPHLYLLWQLEKYNFTDIYHVIRSNKCYPEIEKCYPAIYKCYPATTLCTDIIQ